MKFFRFVTSLVALSGFALIGAAQQSPTASETGVITGHVMNENGNPLVNARVGVDGVVARGPNRISNSTITDDEGYFRLSSLPQGNYYISASADGYLPARDRLPGSSVTLTLKKGGVITGRVTDVEGRAVAAVPLTLEYARDENDRQRNGGNVKYEGRTDDRGVYRFHSLQPGSYLVCAGCRGGQARGVTAFDSDAPTYYPSSARENATEVKVGAGEEATSIDIRYRGERGHAIRGVVPGADDRNHRLNVRLRSLGARGGFTYSGVVDQSLKFAFEGLPDGEYELTAGRGVYSDGDNGATSAPQRVTIKGADVNGIELRLIPLGSLSGRLTIAIDSADCQIQQRKQLTNVYLNLYSDKATQLGSMSGRLDEQGAFALRGVEAGHYRLAAWLPHAEWYLRAITQTGPAPANKPVDVSREGITLQPGEHKTGFIVTVAEGAARLRGKVISATEGASLPSRLRVYLVPAESASAGDALRYVGDDTMSNGRFMMSHIAPGRYYLMARPAPDAESPEALRRPATWSAEDRASLLREARTLKVEIELKACQRVMDYVLRYEAR
jgi:carboxypeptidase family protein